ncbi:MAG: TIR domain-containing protein [Phototrophicaceae bacterium]
MSVIHDNSDVFVSYRRIDVDFVKQVVDALQAKNKEVWVDWEDIPPGSVGFTDDIKHGIENANTFIAVLSPDYMESTYCIDLELGYAAQLNKKIIPIVYRKFDDEVIPPNISHINWIYFTPHAGQANTFEEAFPKIIDAMETDLEHQRLHRRFLVRAIEWDDNHRGNSFFLNGDEIVQAESWLADASGKDPLPSELQKDYIASSRKYAIRVQRQLLTGVSAALILTIFLAIFAGFQWQNANAQRQTAERERDIANSLSIAAGASELNLSHQIEAVGVILEAINLENIPSSVQRTLGEIAYQPGALRILSDNQAETAAVAISPDSMIVAIGTGDDGDDTINDDNRIIIYDLATGERLETWDAHTAPVQALAFSPDGQTLAAGDDNDLITLWDVASSTLLYTLEGHSRGVNALDFSDDGTRLVSGASDETVIIWDVASGETIAIIEMPNRVFAVDFQPDSHTIAIGTRDGIAHLWDTETNTEIRRFEGHLDDILDLTFTSDGTGLITASSDRQIILWNTETGSIIRTFLGHSRIIRSIAVSPDGEYLISGSDDRTMILWRIDTGAALFDYTGMERIIDLAFAADSRTFVAIDNTQTPIVWTAIAGSQLSYYDDYQFDVLDVAISPDSTLVASASASWQVHVINRLANDVFIFDAHQQSVNAVAFSPDGTQIASGDAGGIIYVWDATTGEIAYELNHEGFAATSVSFTPDGNYVVTGGGFNRDAVLRLWDANTGALVREFVGHLGTVYDLAISPDSQMIASAEEGNQIILWDIATGDTLRTLNEHSNAVRSVTFSPDGSQLLSGSFDDSLILWDVATGDVIQQFFGHTDVVRAVAFNPNGQLIISAGSDDVILVWDINDPQAEPIRAYEGHTDNIHGLAYSPNGAYFVSASVDDTVIAWRYDTLEELITWVNTNRYIPALSCNTQRQFRLDLSSSCLN